VEPAPIDRPRVVFLLDVDNTLLDNDAIVSDLKAELTRLLGVQRQERYWTIFEECRSALGYADYLGALQRFRLEDPREPQLLALASFLLNYPFATRIYEGALRAVAHLAGLGQTVILTDGDVVFQPLKIERSGLYSSVGGRVLLYVHKELELADVEKRFPADHYIFVDDKVRLLTAIKKVWGARVTTIFPRQGHYALDPGIAAYPTPDLTVGRFADLIDYALPADVVRPNKTEP
jgi:FMN phosphatase YigB (HAD superfamily)